MEISVKSLWMGASVVITVALITLGLLQYGKAKRLAAMVSDDMGSLEAEIGESEIMRYDGMTVSGSDVRSFTRRLLSRDSDRGIYVLVKGESTSRKYSAYGETDEMLDPESGGYVNPVNRYRGLVEKNGNGVITGIIFEAN